MTSSIDFHGFLAHLFWVTSKLIFSILYLLCLAMNLFSVTSHFVVLNGVIVFCFLCHIRFAVATRLKKAMTSLSFIYRTSVQCLYIPRRLYFVFAEPKSVWYDVPAVVVDDVFVFILYLPSPRRLGVKSV